MNKLDILEWDSDFFGYKVGKIIASSIGSGELATLISEAKDLDVKLIYIFTDPTDVASKQAAASNNAKLVDQKITFYTKITDSHSSVTDEHIQLYEQDYPSEQLISLSMQSGMYSRYKIDPGFKNKEFERLYLRWVENSVNKKIADHTFVYREGENDLGFVTLKIKDGHGQIGLIAVDESSRGKSIGKKLVAAVFNKLVEKRAVDLDVATQVDNEDACNFYKKVGFKEHKADNIYHIWL